MKSGQDRILKVPMSIAVGTIAFCVTVPIVLVLGGMLFGSLGWLNGDGLIPTGFAVLFLIAILVGGIVGIVVGIKYYRYLENPSECAENDITLSRICGGGVLAAQIEPICE